MRWTAGKAEPSNAKTFQKVDGIGALIIRGDPPARLLSPPWSAATLPGDEA